MSPSAGSALEAEDNEQWAGMLVQRGPALIPELLGLGGGSSSSPAPLYPAHQAGKPSLSDVCLALSLDISRESNSAAFHWLSSCRSYKGFPNV